MSSANFVCPKCGLADRIQKVSSIVAQNTSTVQMPDTQPVQIGKTTYYLPITQQGSSTTMLAQRLLPNLQKSIKPTKAGLAMVYFIVFGVYLWIIVTVVGGIVMIFAQNGSGAILSIFFFGLALGAYLIRPKFKVKDEYKKAEVAYQKGLQDNKVATARWNQLYYCYRDDGIFTEYSRFVPTEQMGQFLIE
jgi:hypothetical protein